MSNPKERFAKSIAESLVGVAHEAVIRPEIRALVERGNVTAAEIKELYCNSWEWEALIPAMNDEAFLGRAEHALRNCSIPRQPCATYDEAVVGMYGPELLKRFKSAIEMLELLNEAHGSGRPEYRK